MNKQKYKNLIEKLHRGQHEDFPALAADICFRTVIPQKFILNITNDLLDKKIVIYGAGGVGYSYYLQLYKYSRCQVVAWVDKNYSKYNYKEGKVKSIENMRELDYDIVLIAVRDELVAKEIKSSLINSGVESKKLYWISPVCN